MTTVPSVPSYASGISDVPLLGDTIGDNFDRSVSGDPDREALVGAICGYTAADRVCIPVPFYHSFGMVMGNLASTSHGATMVIPAQGFDPKATLDAVARERCTSLYGVPTMFIAELNHPDFDSYDLSSLRTGIMAGSPCPVEVMVRNA